MQNTIFTFIKYTLVGSVNTVIHWAVFYAIFYLIIPSQPIANFIGFSFAVTFSFFVNANFTFKSQTNKKRYILFVSFMGGLSIVFGLISEQLSLPSLVTLITFSSTSLVLGYIFSKFIVFRTT